MESNRTAIAAWSGGVGALAAAIAAALLSLAGTIWQVVAVLFLGIAALALVLLISTAYAPARAWLAARSPSQSFRPGPADTSLWRTTNNSTELLPLTHLRNIAFSGPGSIGAPGDTRPIVRIGAVVACDPFDPSADATELRSRFRSFLTGEPFMTLISDLTHIGTADAWRSLTGNGSLMLEAAMIAEGQTGAPAAAAALLLPNVGQSLGYGQDQRYAELRLHIEPRTADGSAPPATKLIEWQVRFARALAVPGLLAGFLSHDLELATHSETPAKFAILLETQGPLTQLIDIGDLKPLPGMPAGGTFMGWAIASQGGKPARPTARDLMITLCEHTLRLDGYKSALLDD